MGILDLKNYRSQPEQRPIQYRGTDKKVHEAMERISPITWDSAQPAYMDDIDEFRIIDDFIAVVDGSKNLRLAFEQARKLIQISDFQAVIIARNSSTLLQSEDRLDHSFYNYKLPKQNAIILPNQNGKFLYEKPIQSILSVPSYYLIAEKLGLAEIPEFLYPKIRRPKTVLGCDMASIMTEARQLTAFPEYASWLLTENRSSSEPGIIHLDSSYEIETSRTPWTPRDERFCLLDLPSKFVHGINKEQFDALPGNITLTTAFNGGTVLCKMSPAEYEAYAVHRRNGEQEAHKMHFVNTDKPGYQVCDGDVFIGRAEGWPADENGNPRLAVPHFSPFVSKYGHVGEKLSSRGRKVALASCRVAYFHPQVRESLGLSRIPSDDPVTVLEQVILKSISKDIDAKTLCEAFQDLDPRIIQQLDLDAFSSFPQETQTALKESLNL